MLLSRDELISTLFRETDRAQRMKTPLSLIHCGIEDWADWRLQLGEGTLEVARTTIAERIAGLLRCYDSVGQIAEGEFVIVLPGCSNAVRMAGRLKAEVFASPLEVAQRRIRFSACFGVVGSAGRSPFVLLRDAEHALQLAKACGPGEVASLPTDSGPDNATFLVPISHKKSLRR